MITRLRCSRPLRCSPLGLFSVALAAGLTLVGCDQDKAGDRESGQTGEADDGNTEMTSSTGTTTGTMSSTTSGTDGGSTTTSSSSTGSTDTTGSTTTSSADTSDDGSSATADTSTTPGTEHIPQLTARLGSSCDRWLSPLPATDTTRLIAELEHSLWFYSDKLPWFFGTYGATEAYEDSDLWTAWAIDEGHVVTEYWGDGSSGDVQSYARYFDTVATVDDHLAHTGYCSEVIFSRTAGTTGGEGLQGIQGAWETHSGRGFFSERAGVLWSRNVETRTAKFTITDNRVEYAGVTCTSDLAPSGNESESVLEGKDFGSVSVDGTTIELTTNNNTWVLTKLDDDTLRLTDWHAEGELGGLPIGTAIDTCVRQY